MGWMIFHPQEEFMRVHKVLSQNSKFGWNVIFIRTISPTFPCNKIYINMYFVFHISKWFIFPLISHLFFFNYFCDLLVFLNKRKKIIFDPYSSPSLTQLLCDQTSLPAVPPITSRVGEQVGFDGYQIMLVVYVYTRCGFMWSPQMSTSYHAVNFE